MMLYPAEIQAQLPTDLCYVGKEIRLNWYRCLGLNWDGYQGLYPGLTLYFINTCKIYVCVLNQKYKKNCKIYKVEGHYDFNLFDEQCKTTGIDYVPTGIEYSGVTKVYPYVPNKIVAEWLYDRITPLRNELTQHPLVLASCGDV